MGIRDLISGRTRELFGVPVSLPLSGLYSPAVQLPPMVITDLLSDEAQARLPMDRSQMISIPAVSKARNLLVSAISSKPLRAIRTNADGTETDVTSQHPWLYRTNSAVSPYERMAWTIDDLIFNGVSLWLLERGAPGPDGRRAILSTEWCPSSSWAIVTVDGQLVVTVDGVPIAEDRCMLINSPFEGLLNIAGRSMRGARDTEESWVGRARNPVPMIDLHRTDDDEMSAAEVKAYVDAWSAARTSPNGAIGSTPHNIEIRTYGELKAEVMIEGRNAVRTDVGSFLNVRVAMLDGTIGVDSLTYSTKDGERNAFYEFDLPFWTDPIAARFSLDDIVPRGTRIRFDMYEAFNPPTATGATVED